MGGREGKKEIDTWSEPVLIVCVSFIFGLFAMLLLYSPCENTLLGGRESKELNRREQCFFVKSLLHTSASFTFTFTLPLSLSLALSLSLFSRSFFFLSLLVASHSFFFSHFDYIEKVQNRKFFMEQKVG